MRRFTRHPSLLPSRSLANRSQLPKSPGVYYLIQWWRPWRVLYIGMSGQMNRRWNAKGDWQHHKLADMMTRSAVRIHFRVTKTSTLAARLEAIEIDRHTPSLNGRRERRHSFSHHDIVDAFSDLGVLTIAAAIGWVLLRLLMR